MYIYSSDWLEIHDGPNETSPIIGKEMCGSQKDIPYLIKSTGNELFVSFHSDFNPTWHDQGYEIQIITGI